MNSMRFRKSLTKNWPSGRRNATILTEDGTSSFRIWNHALTNFKKPYLAKVEPLTDAAAEGLLSS